jgi:precorrin-4/cobalt-precorrin-4 C11-methyltransferase
MKNNVYFIGAGPGDPKLLTIRGKELIDAADVIIYAGSLVNPEILRECKADASIYNSASMTLEEVVEVIKVGFQKNQKVVRVHTGDPSIYGAIREQFDALSDLEIPFEVIPGVSSFSAAAASIKKEFTLPGVSQTVILTRLEGRTPVPEQEQLEQLAKHQTSMALFLSVGMMEEVVQRLLTSYPKSTPVAVIQRASWEDEKIVMGTLETIAEKVSQAKITKTAQILVGKFIEGEYERSLLYDKTFSHEYRKAKESESE